MVINLLDNTDRISELQSRQPHAFLRRAGLMGIGSYPIDSVTELGADPRSDRYVQQTGDIFREGTNAIGLAGLGEATDPTGFSMSDMQNVIPMLNTEWLYIENMMRAKAGKPLLPVQQLAPTVNVGVSQDTTRAAVGIAAVIALAVMFARKRR